MKEIKIKQEFSIKTPAKLDKLSNTNKIKPKYFSDENAIAS
jgi:hypothetical protein